MQIAILLFERFTALDAVGPYDVLSHLPNANVVFVAQQPGPVVNEVGTALAPFRGRAQHLDDLGLHRIAPATRDAGNHAHRYPGGVIGEWDEQSRRNHEDVLPAP